MKRSTKIITATAVVALTVVAIGGASFASARGGHGYGNCERGGPQMGMMRGGKGGQRMMERFDANGDGKITAEEMAEVRTKAMTPTRTAPSPWTSSRAFGTSSCSAARCGASSTSTPTVTASSPWRN
jgi:hypothetical protein